MAPLAPFVILLALGAEAGPLTWTTASGTDTSNDISSSLTCPDEETVVGGGFGVQLNYMASRVLQGSVSSGPSTWVAASNKVAGAPDENWPFTISALCAQSSVAACIERVEAVSPIDVSPAKTATALCPADTFAFSGGAELIGNPTGRGFRSLGPTGLVLPLGWGAQVDGIDGGFSATPWGVRVVAWCAPASAVADHITVMPHTQPDNICIDSDCMLPGFSYAAHATYRYGAPNSTLEACWEPLSVGMYGDVGRFVVDSGPTVSNGLAAQSIGRIGTFDPSTSSTGVGLCADNLTAFGLAIANHCAEPPEPPEGFDVPHWRVGATILLGLDVGGGGVIFLPGSGIVPVDPEPFRHAFESLPVAVLRYTDAEGLAAAVDQIRSGFDAEQLVYEELEDTGEAIDTDRVVLLFPADEAQAIAMLSEARATLAERRNAIFVFLEADGEGMDALAEWCDATVAHDPVLSKQS